MNLFDLCKAFFIKELRFQLGDFLFFLSSEEEDPYSAFCKVADRAELCRTNAKYAKCFISVVDRTVPEDFLLDVYVIDDKLTRVVFFNECFAFIRTEDLKKFDEKLIKKIQKTRKDKELLRKILEEIRK